jgi:hypothetical protein
MAPSFDDWLNDLSSSWPTSVTTPTLTAVALAAGALLAGALVAGALLAGALLAGALLAGALLAGADEAGADVAAAVVSAALGAAALVAAAVDAAGALEPAGALVAAPPPHAPMTRASAPTSAGFARVFRIRFLLVAPDPSSETGTRALPSRTGRIAGAL